MMGSRPHDGNGTGDDRVDARTKAASLSDTSARLLTVAQASKETQRAELHKTIWRIANDLRGSVDGWDFKTYVLGMLFYRFTATGTAITAVFPPTSRFAADGGHGAKKQRVLDRLSTFFERFAGLSA
jgi:hypothetical protein